MECQSDFVGLRNQRSKYYVEEAQRHEQGQTSNSEADIVLVSANWSCTGSGMFDCVV